MESLLFRELSAGEIKNTVSSALGAAPVSYELLTGGLFNTSYLIETENGGKFVLRAGPVNRHLLLPYELHLMEAEKEAYRLFSLNGVPGSEIVFLDVSRTLADRDLMIVRYLNGGPLSEDRLSPEEIESVSEDVGATCRKMHRITSPKFGRIYDVMNCGGYDSWHQALLKEIREAVSMCEKADIFTSSERSGFITLSEHAGALLSDVTVPSFVHCDIWEGNILVGGSPAKLLALIDADRAIWGDPLLEFAATGWPAAHPGFWKGYGNKPPEDGASEAKTALYRMFICISYAYIYLAEYRDAKLCGYEADRAKKAADRLSELL